MTNDADQLVDMMKGAMESTIPIAHKMGVKVVEARPGFAATTVPRRRQRQPLRGHLCRRAVHGG
ncbi:MAG TPA: hypothetical protein VEF72_00495 [Mycobacterium sp.]|nr:hypothetical protein [Mycobacterium sp.]